jgi:negative regulator of replication initiation
MPTIKVDDEVFALLQKNAKPFVDSPNSTLRRMLGLRMNGTVAEPTGTTDELEQLPEQAMAGRRTKAPKADLKTLIQAGLLRNGDRLYLVDYQGKRVTQYEAVVSGALLEFKGQHYTMSNLAQELLKKVGFKSDSVRGPSHWVTAKNVSIKDLWQQYMDKRAKK